MSAATVAASLCAAPLPLLGVACGLLWLCCCADGTLLARRRDEEEGDDEAALVGGDGT